MYTINQSYASGAVDFYNYALKNRFFTFKYKEDYKYDNNKNIIFLFTWKMYTRYKNKVYIGLNMQTNVIKRDNND